MQGQKYSLPYGKSNIEFSIPSTMNSTLALSRPAKPLKDFQRAIAEALAHPVGSAPLSEIARRGERVCIVFTDITRACPDHLLIPALLGELEKAGIKEEDITLLCGTGMHRPSTPEEKVIKLGADIATRYRVIDNEAQNPKALVDLGSTPGGVPVQLHRAVVEADLVVSTGIVEPHQYAGYSGGAKTVSVGAAGEALIAHTHGPTFVDHPGTRLGSIDGNPFRQAMTEVARQVGLRFILNVVMDDEKRILRVTAGDPDLAFQQLVAFAKTVYEVPIPHQFDIAIGGVGFPKDINLYQASRAPSYLFFAPVPVIRPGGSFIIPARCQEGAGSGVGEQRFLTAMREAPDVQSILEDARRNGYPPGQQRAFVLAKVLEQNQVIIVGSECPELVSACKMIPIASMQAAIEFASQRSGEDSQVLIVPHALLTLPIISQ